MARILIVDDDENVVDIVARALKSQDYAVLVAYGGHEAIDQLHMQRPDLIILDILMPEIDGLQVCKFIRMNPRLASVPVLFLSGKTEVEDRIRGFELGCDDYLMKPFHLNELILRVRALLRHTRRVAPNGPLIMGALCVDPNSGVAEIEGEPVDLTPVEFELLYYMIAHGGEVVSTERLLRDVWEYPPGMGNPSLVRMHVLNLRRKIEKDPRKPTFLCTIPRHGYLIRATQPV
ncbi:MAG: hypothetical protein A2Y73_00150 [Chloroflexi bacterium RBG_13_56_8]|nr:MAG: hypothetical protein A2Y73_00150 [Chloroflexi bacterium RBG_13_56_8]